MIESRSVLGAGAGLGAQRAKSYEGSFLRNGNVLYYYSTGYRTYFSNFIQIVHLTLMKFIVCKLYLNKPT